MKKKLEAERMETQPAQSAPKEEDSSYIFPPVTMLASGKKVDAAVETEELQTNGKLLVETLKSFGVQTKILDICRGPAVTRYELQPAAGVKISKITNLADDLAMNLAATGVRIEAPIPGKAAVGIEVPNKVKTIVRMRELVESNSFVTSKSHLTVALGRDIAGQVTVADLSKMPHILIAGTTGSGKSVCINSLIVSLLYKSGPDDVRFLMIDPKVVELGIYNGIPHLLVPVVTDPRKAAGALNWAVTEMLKRYKIFAENNVRDLKGYNAPRAGEQLSGRKRTAHAQNAADRHHHRRAFRPDDGRAERGGRRDLPLGADGACRRHAPCGRNAAPVRGRCDGPHQGEHPESYRVCGVLCH